MNSKFVGLALAGLIFLPGCLHVPTYKAKPLKDLSDNFVYREIKNNVVFQAKCLTHGEIYYLFGERTQELLKTTEIIHCSIHNLSRQDYVLSLDNSSLSPLSMHNIKRLIKTKSASAVKEAVLAGAGSYGLFAISFTVQSARIPPVLSMSAALTNAVATFAYIYFIFPIVAAMISMPFLGKAIKSMIMNSRINKDLNEKVLHKNAIIKSGDILSGLIFVKAADYNPQFSVMMQEKNNSKNKMLFDVDVTINAKIMQ